MTTSVYLLSVGRCSLIIIDQEDESVCDCQSKNLPDSHLPVFQEIPF